jgi:hypothetical protein
MALLLCWVAHCCSAEFSEQQLLCGVLGRMSCCYSVLLHLEACWEVLLSVTPGDKYGPIPCSTVAISSSMCFMHNTFWPLMYGEACVAANFEVATSEQFRLSDLAEEHR